MPDLCNKSIREAHDLGFFQYLKIIDVLFQLFLHIHDLLIGFQEEFRDHCDLVDLFDRYATAEQFKNSKNVIISELFNVIEKFLFCKGVETFLIEMINSNFQRTNGFQETLFQRRADAHNLTGCFHLCSKDIGSGCEFIKREPREFCHDIIQTWGNGCCTASDRNIFQGHA